MMMRTDHIPMLVRTARAYLETNQDVLEPAEKAELEAVLGEVQPPIPDAAPKPAVRLSPVQAGLQIVQQMVMGGIGDDEYKVSMDELHRLMGQWALAQIRPEYEGHMREVDPDYVLTLEEVTSEDNEDSQMAQAYWAATSTYFRKVFQAAAAAA